MTQKKLKWMLGNDDDNARATSIQVNYKRTKNLEKDK